MKNILKKLKKNKELTAVISLPIVMMLIVAVIVYIPGLFIKPTYDFVYYKCDSYCYNKSFKVDDNSKVEEVINIRYETNNSRSNEAQLYYYSVSEGKSRKISLAEAEQYRLDDSSKSPDGFEISNDYGYGGFFMFGYYGSNGEYKKLQKGTASFDTDIDRYDYKFEFLGWVE